MCILNDQIWAFSGNNPSGWISPMHLKPGTNMLRVEVANTWANGLVGDARLPRGQKADQNQCHPVAQAWSYPMEEIPNEDYGLLDGGIVGACKNLYL